MLFIDNDTVKQTLSIADSIDSQDRAFRGLVDGGSIHRPRIDVYVPTGREEDYYRWGTMEGASRDLGVFAIRMKSDVVSWPEDASGNWTEEKYCVEPGTYCGLIMLFSTVNGEPLAMINDGYLQHMRVGAGAWARRAFTSPARTPALWGCSAPAAWRAATWKRSATSGPSPRCGSTAPRRSTGRATPPR